MIGRILNSEGSSQRLVLERKKIMVAARAMVSAGLAGVISWRCILFRSFFGMYCLWYLSEAGTDFPHTVNGVTSVFRACNVTHDIHLSVS